MCVMYTLLHIIRELEGNQRAKNKIINIEVKPIGLCKIDFCKRFGTFTTKFISRASFYLTRKYYKMTI